MRCLIAALTTACLTSWPKPHKLAEVCAARTIEITGEQRHKQFAVANAVNIRANVVDDVFAAGRLVTLKGPRARTLVAGAGRLVIRSRTIQIS